MDRLVIIDSTTISLFSNLIFKGVGRHPKTSKKKGGIKVHAVIHAKEGVPSDIKLSSAATNITYIDVKKCKPISLLTNDMDSDPAEIIEIYRQRWEIELLFKQMKQNFPLKYFYGESANAIKIQIWVTLIANLLLMVLQKGLKRKWGFSGLATMFRITLMYYVDFNHFFNNPEKSGKSSSQIPSVHRLIRHFLTEGGACKIKNMTRTPYNRRSSHILCLYLSFIGQ